MNTNNTFILVILLFIYTYKPMGKEVSVYNFKTC